MQRLFSTFPNSMPGVALLLLRWALGIPLIADGYVGLWESPEPAALLMLCARLIGGGLICAGLWTPVIAILVAILELWAAFAVGNVGDAHVLRGIVALSLATIGPGAWSVDARIFGRKRFNFDAADD